MITSFNLDWEDKSDNNDLKEIEDHFPDLDIDRSKRHKLIGEDRDVFIDEILSDIMSLINPRLKRLKRKILSYQDLSQVLLILWGMALTCVWMGI